MFCVGNEKLSSFQKDVKGPNSHYDEMEMGPHSKALPKSHSKSIIEAQYEECRQGVTSSDVVIEENPAYQSVDVTAAKP